MNRARVQQWALAVVLAALAGCGRAPTSPSPQISFLVGTWTGTLSIERENEPVASGSTTWTFAVVPDTNQQTFRVTIQSQHPWLPITTTMTSALTPSNMPPTNISTQGNYTSPRGCTGNLLSVGTATTIRIDADFAGVDCPNLTSSTFDGHVTLTKVGG